ncbi:coil containing protein [Vibrio phage LP.2]|nr:coil containing protein [Vibrio phage LP.2]
MKMSDELPKVFQASGNPSFDVQDCKYISYGEGFRTTAQEDSAIEIAVLNHDALTERVKELEVLVESSFREGYSSGYADGSSDGQSYSGRTCRDDDGEWLNSDAKELLEKNNET